MAFTYKVSSGLSATGPFTVLPGSPFSSTTDVVTGLSPATNYWFQIIVNDTLTGLASAPVVNGPFTTAAAGPSESPDGTSVTDATGIIFASQTFGQASAPGAPLDKWQLTAPGGFAILNGTILSANTANVTKLYYINHFLYQTSPNGNVLGTPGWWRWDAVTPWVPVTNPIPPTPVIGLNTIANQNANQAFAISGTLVNYTSIPTLQFSDNNSGVWTALPTGSTVTLTTFSFNHPQVTAIASMTVSIRDANNNSISVTSNAFSVTVPGQITLQSILLSNNTATAGLAAGQTVGTISVQAAGGTYTGTNSVDDITNFKITGNTTLQTNAVLNNQTYNINLTATQAGALGSPLTKPFVITSGPAGGPTASGNFVNIDFTNMVSPNGVTGAIVFPQLFGAATGGAANGGFSWFGNGTWRNLARALNLPLLRLHSGDFDGNNPSSLDPVINNISNIVPSTCTMMIGVQANSTANYKAFADHYAANAPIPCNYWQIGNEIGGQPETIDAYMNVYTPGAAGIHQSNANFKVGGPVWAGFDGSHLNSGPSAGAFAQFIARNTASTMQFLDWHQYVYCQNNSDFPNVPTDAQACLAINPNTLGPTLGTPIGPGAQFPVMAQQMQALTAGTYASNYPMCISEYNLECSAGSDNRAGTSIGVCCLISMLLGFASASTQPAWGAIWDLADDNGAWYNLIDQNLNLSPQYYGLQQLIAHMPGTMVNSASPATGLQAWATKSGTNFCVAIVNSNGSQSSGQVALSHWPVNTTGNATVHMWTYPSTSNNGPVLNQPGSTGTLAVTNGMTASISVPAHSAVLIFSP